MTVRSETAITLTRVDDGDDGQTYYTWIKYSDVLNPTTSAEIYDNPTATTISIGIAVNKATETKSTNPADYTWSKFKGDDGDDGDDGIGLSSTVMYYQLAASAPATTPDNDVNWVTTEPGYVEGSLDNLYTIQRFNWSNNTHTYGAVNLSSSYAAAKEAYTIANSAVTLANGKVAIGTSGVDDLADIIEFVNDGTSRDGLHIKQSAIISGMLHDFDAHITADKISFLQDGNEIAFAGTEKFEAQEVSVQTKVQGGENYLTIGNFRLGTHQVSDGTNTFTNLRLYYIGE